ncbi:hypothetical protein OC846_006851, partial [Tilletia horrida]
LWKPCDASTKLALWLKIRVRAAAKKFGYDKISHPGSSPDLNAIETIWRKLKSNIKYRPGPIRT